MLAFVYTAAPYSGVYVYVCAAADAQLVVGAKLKVQGMVTEFDATVPAVGDTQTQIKNATLTFRAVPTTAPIALTGLVRFAGRADVAQRRECDGVLVELTNVHVTSNTLGSNKLELSDSNGNKIVVDDDAFRYVTTTTRIPAMNTCYSSLTGVMSLQLSDNIRTLNPRSAADMVTGNTCN